MEIFKIKYTRKIKNKSIIVNFCRCHIAIDYMKAEQDNKILSLLVIEAFPPTKCIKRIL